MNELDRDIQERVHGFDGGENMTKSELLFRLAMRVDRLLAESERRDYLDTGDVLDCLNWMKEELAKQQREAPL